MNAAEIKIGVDRNLNLKIGFVGDENFLVALLGGITQAGQWVGNRLQKRMDMNAWAPVDGVSEAPKAPSSVAIEPEDSREYSMEQKMPRDKAIEATEYAIEAMRQRVEAMRKSPATATFSINPELLSKL